MTRDDWWRLLEPWASEAVRRARIEAELDEDFESEDDDEPPDVPAGPLSGLGAPGATEDELAAAEARLGCRLPPSYREFLGCTNGLRQPDDGIMALVGGHFWNAAEVDWFRVRNQNIIDIWNADSVEVPDERYFVYGREQESVNIRPEYLRNALELMYDGDAGWYLLIPDVVGADGEWEAWHFASWHPGAERYRSFAEMMQAHRASFEAGKYDGF